MASFEKKLIGFLDSAVEHRIIGRPAAENLTAFANSGEYEHKGWFSLSAAMGGLGALVLCFGIILLIATNWYMFSDITKITGFLILMGGSHFAGIYAKSKSYEKFATALHLLGAGLFLAGIGLVAQIFNLSSDTGKSFLVWAIMIAPLAILLRNGPVALLSVVAFTIWGNTYLEYLHKSYNFPITLLAFNSSVVFLMVFAGIILRKKGSEIASYLQIPGMLGVIGMMYGFGFIHHAGYSNFDSKEGLLISFLLFIPVLAMMGYLWIKDCENAKDRYFLIAMSFAILTIVLTFIMVVIGLDKGSYTEHFSFGWTKRIYFMPLMISISAWVAYFGLAFWGVIYGALSHDRRMLNSSVLLIGIGIFTRFIDLMGSMMNTGIMFIICGLLLFTIGYVLEKWRRNLIANAIASKI